MMYLGQVSAAAMALLVLAACPQNASAAQPTRTSVELVAQSAPRPGAVIFDNGNIYAVFTQPTAAPIVRLDRRTQITAVTTYHWNDGRGAQPGYIALVDARGRLMAHGRRTVPPARGRP